jgi:hypothetical protein
MADNEDATVVFSQVGDVYPRAGKNAIQFPGSFTVEIAGIVGDGCLVRLEKSTDGGVTWSALESLGLLWERSANETKTVECNSRRYTWRLRCLEHNGTPFRVGLLGN